MDRRDVNAGLDRQGLKRELSEGERQLGHAMEQIFRSGVTGFERVASLLQQNGVAPPSGAAGPWSVALLQEELAIINQSLDRAYEDGGTSPGR